MDSIWSSDPFRLRNLSRNWETVLGIVLIDCFPDEKGLLAGRTVL